MVKRIMVVDDEPDTCKLLERLLETKGFEVITASSGAECLTKLQNEKVDLLLIDFFMPRMSGRELLEEIRKDRKLKNQKAAFITAATFGEAGMKKLRELKALDYIQKPFDNDDLVTRIKQMIK